MTRRDLRHTPTPRLVAELDELLDAQRRVTDDWLVGRVKDDERSRWLATHQPKIAALRFEVARRNAKERK